MEVKSMSYGIEEQTKNERIISVKYHMQIKFSKIIQIFLEHYFGNLKNYKLDANPSLSGQDKQNAGILCDDDLLIETQY